MMGLWTAQEAIAATGGTGPGDWIASGVSIDTRTLEPGDLFVALKDARDGHDFVARALAEGAAAALVSRIPDGVSPDAPLLLVPDVQRALEALGRAARARTRARLVGVTGSVGKTSTKEMLRHVLGGQGRVHAAEASYNNHWGVPLTLARMTRGCDFAVIEIGMNHPGEIAPLARMADLDLAIITTIAPAHLAAFDSVDDIAREKSAILQGLRPGGTAILPLDIPTAAIPLAEAAARGLRAITFGAAEAADFRLIEARLGDRVTTVQARSGQRPILYKIASAGRHFAMNGLAVLAAAEALGLDPAIAAADLGRWEPPPGRGQRETIVLDPVEELGFDLIDDAFNANPASMAAALEVLASASVTEGVGRHATGRRIAILGDMLELGAGEAEMHRAIASHPVLSAVGTIHCVGPRMRALYDCLPARQRGHWTERAQDLAAGARSLIDAGDVVLVKGSKGSKVSLVVEALRKLGRT
ncbi:MAG: UDP-N-acetylmuramoyl-tripeptide--D-alanyl-D-alanine ligase [Paracoccaceae bacterium]